jgi:hypothetical protein
MSFMCVTSENDNDLSQHLQNSWMIRPKYENFNKRHGIDAFLIKSCSAVVQNLYLLSLKLTLSAYQTDMTCT